MSVQSSRTCVIVSDKCPCDIRTHRQLKVWFASLRKVMTAPCPRVPCASGETCTQTKREYLDPVSVSWKASIIQTGLIRSALIAILNNGNDVKYYVCASHPSLCCLAVLPSSVPATSGAGEWVLWCWWRADVAGALLMIWGQALHWTWKGFKGKADFWHYASGFPHSVWIYTE